MIPKIKPQFKYAEVLHSFYTLPESITIDNRTFYIAGKQGHSALSRFLRKQYNCSIYDIVDTTELNLTCAHCHNATKFIMYRNIVCVSNCCSTACSKAYHGKLKYDAKMQEDVQCKWCGKHFKRYELHDKNYLCSDKCKIEFWQDVKVRRGKAIANKHWAHKDNAEDIIHKIVTTKKNSDKPKKPAWNKGKHGIYSNDTIERIREGVRRSQARGVYKKTGIEIRMESLLNELQIPFKYSVIIGKRQYDFQILNCNLLIECDGDYWHGNPARYQKLNEMQIFKHKDAAIKNRIAKENGFEILRFWETDIWHNYETVKQIIYDTISKLTKKL